MCSGEVEDDLNCQELASYLLLKSIEAANGAISDDMMVLVARLLRNIRKSIRTKGVSLSEL